MAIVKCKPTSAGRRHMVKIVTPELHKGAPHAPLLEKKSKTGGRNNDGRITTRHIGGGHKQHYRVIDFKRNKDGIPAEDYCIEKLLPICKWVSAIIELPIEMTPEQIEEEERDETGYGGWWYIARDIEVRIAGIQLNAYIPNGSKYFSVYKEH